jgi:hypothetical protein
MMQKRKHTADKDGRPLVVLPSDSEVGRALTTQRLCLFCTNWDLELGQEECRKQKFWQRMLKEEKYRPDWFEDPRTYGLCKAFDGRLVPSIAPATCVASDLNAEKYNKPGAMDKLPCPFYRDKRETGSRMFIGAHAKSKLDH